MRSERPLSSVSDHHLTYQSSHSTSRLSDIPTRLSGWFQHSSATNLSLLHLINTSPLPSGSPKGNLSALLTVVKHSKGHLDKAMCYLIDGDYIPDKKAPTYSNPAPRRGCTNTGYERGLPPAKAMLTRSSPIPQDGHPPSVPQHIRFRWPPLSSATRSYPLSNDFQYAPAHNVSQNPTILRYASGSHCSPPYTPFETRHSSFSNANRLRPLQPASQHLSPPVLRQNTGGPATRRMAKSRWVGLYAANWSIVACDDPSTSTFRARYVIFSFLNASLTSL